MTTVTVAVPAFNSGRWIADTIASLQAQTLQDWQAIVYDDASTDDTTAVAKEASAGDDRITVLTATNNRGVAWAINQGIYHGRGRYLQMLAADDILEPRKLELQAAHLDANPDVGVVYGAARYFTDGHPEQRRLGPHADVDWTAQLDGGRDVILPRIAIKSFFATPAALIRADLFFRLGFLPENLRSNEDWHFFFRCAVADVRFESRHWPDALVLCRVHDTSLTANTRLMWETKVRAHRMLAPLVADDPAAAKANLNGEAVAWRQLAQIDIAAGRHRDAAAALLRAGRCEGAAAVPRAIVRAGLASVGRWPRRKEHAHA